MKLSQSFYFILLLAATSSANLHGNAAKLFSSEGSDTLIAAEEAGYWDRQLGRHSSMRKKTGSKGQSQRQLRNAANTAFMDEVALTDEEAGFWDRELGRKSSMKKKSNIKVRHLRKNVEADNFLMTKEEIPEEEVAFWARELERKSSMEKKSKGKGK